MRTITFEDEIIIPEWVVDLDSFRRWADSEDFPETGRVDYIRGGIWIDMSREQVFSHNQVKFEFNLVLGYMIKSGRLGRYFPDGVRLSHVLVDFNVVPDGTFVSTEAWQSERVRLLPGKRHGFVELEGIPDMVLEIIISSSVQKDTVRLRDAYWEAKISEYWLVDARKTPLRFDILRHSPRGYVAARKQEGWMKSVVFGKSFRLVEEKDILGYPDYTLEAR